MTATVLPETDAPSTALARRPSQVSLLRPIAPAADVIAAQDATRELIAKALKKGRDYGEIPGTNKPTLFKAGAERVALGFGCFARFRTLESEVDHDREFKYIKKSKVWKNRHKGDRAFDWKEEPGVSLGLYRYVVECEIVLRETNEVVGSFIGSCSSMESKYIDRPRDVENTIIKMAEKRALVGAALTTFGLSDQFTQDVEDLADNQNASAAEDVVDAEVVKDLAWAKAFPLPFRKHKHHGEPIGDRTTEELEKALAWTIDKIRDAGNEGRELAPTDLLVEFKEALTLILEERKAEIEKSQTRLDLDSPATAGRGGVNVPSSEAASGSDHSSPSSTSVPVPPPGKVSDAIQSIDDPTSIRALHARAKKALESPAIGRELREKYADANVNGFKRPHNTLAWWVKELEWVVSRANRDDSFPAALEDSAKPGQDGLPF